jgi:hypothetical protein
MIIPKPPDGSLIITGQVWRPAATDGAWVGAWVSSKGMHLIHEDDGWQLRASRYGSALGGGATPVGAIENAIERARERLDEARQALAALQSMLSSGGEPSAVLGHREAPSKPAKTCPGTLIDMGEVRSWLGEEITVARALRQSTDEELIAELRRRLR